MNLVLSRILRRDEAFAGLTLRRRLMAVHVVIAEMTEPGQICQCISLRHVCEEALRAGSRCERHSCGTCLLPFVI